MAFFFTTFVIVFLYQFYSANGDYTAKLSDCPDGYSGIANGCYYIAPNASRFTQAEAYSLCTNNFTAPSPIITHLVSIESQAESIALQIWLNSFLYSCGFWTDGVMGNSSKRMWSWSGQDYTFFGKIQDIHINDQPIKKYMNLIHNNTNDYEFEDNDGTQKMSFICEAQVPCYASDNVCMNGGSCWVNNGRVLCTCVPGYVGQLCEQQVDNCDSVPCLHGGGCNNLVNNYTCNCTSFYTGRNCETPVSYEYQDAITAVFSVSLTIVGVVLVALCIMDAPWSEMIALWRKKRAAKQIKSKSSDEEHSESIEKEKTKMPTKAQLLASEQEMLKRFRAALEQSRRAPLSRYN